MTANNLELNRADGFSSTFRTTKLNFITIILKVLKIKTSNLIKNLFSWPEVFYENYIARSSLRIVITAGNQAVLIQ